MKNIPFTRMEVTNEPLTANAGLAVIGQLMRIAGIEQVRSSQEMPNFKIRDADILKALCGLLAVGKVGFDHIRLFAKEVFFKDALGISRMPKEAALRQRFEGMSQDRRVGCGRVFRAPVAPDWRIAGADCIFWIFLGTC
jgi:hypothetical protein